MWQVVFLFKFIQMIRVIIVDDEPMARNTLARMLGKYFSDSVRVVEQCGDVRTAAQAVMNYRPDIVFLDIEMPEHNGFMLFDLLDQVAFETIFTTAYKNYAIEAIKVSALDYLLKPINFIDLKEALDRYAKRKAQSLEKDKVEHLIHHLHRNPGPHGKVAIPTFEGFRMQDVGEIVYCEADQNYTRIHTIDGQEILVSKALGHVEKLLPEDLFFRIHKSHLVNIHFIRLYSRKDGAHVLLEDGTMLAVAARRNEQLVRKLKNDQAESDD